MEISAYSCLHSKLLFQTSRFTSGSSSHLTNAFRRLKTFFGMAEMLSLLLQITFAKDVFLISSSWQAVNAIFSVCNEAEGSFSYQKRSPTRKRRNCSAIRHWKVGPSTPPFVESLRGSRSPKECEVFCDVSQRRKIWSS